MAEYQPQLLENEQSPLARSVDISTQLGPETVPELIRNAKRLADTAINVGIESDSEPLVDQAAEVKVPEIETLSPEAIFALIMIASSELVKRRTHAVEVSQMQGDIRNG